MTVSWNDQECLMATSSVQSSNYGFCLLIIHLQHSKSVPDVLFLTVEPIMSELCFIDWGGAFLSAGGVWAASVQEDVGVEAMGPAGGGATSQPVEMAHLNTFMYMLMRVCVFNTSASNEVLYK